MKSFRILKNVSSGPLQPALVIELSVVDIIKMLFGKELMLPNKSTEIIVLRNAVAYEAFNLAAPRVEG